MECIISYKGNYYEYNKANFMLLAINNCYFTIISNGLIPKNVKIIKYIERV